MDRLHRAARPQANESADTGFRLISAADSRRGQNHPRSARILAGRTQAPKRRKILALTCALGQTAALFLSAQTNEARSFTNVTTTSLASNLTGSLTLDSNRIWKSDSVGTGFRSGLHEAGFSLGGGFATHDGSGGPSHDFVLSRGYFGWMLGGVRAEGKWYRGNWELVEELFGGVQVHPGQCYLIGQATLVRYNFATGTRWCPFVDCGGGVAATDIGPPELGSVFQFNLQGSAGVNYFLRPNVALNVQYRFLHVSNGGLREPNDGVNESVFFAGLSWFF